MGHLTAPEGLALRWAEVCNDPSLQGLNGPRATTAFGVRLELPPR